MLHPTDRLMIDDILRVTAARLAPPAGAALVATGKTSPAHLTLESYQRWGGQFDRYEIGRRGGFKWLRAAAVLAGLGVDLDNDGPGCDPRWATLLAGRYADGSTRGHGVTRIADAGPSRAAIIEDIVRVTAAAGLAPPVRPSFHRYRKLGGVYPAQHVRARGDWASLCAEAGFTADHPAKLDVQTLRSLVIQDIARVAAALAAADLPVATSNGLAKQEYLAAGARSSVSIVEAVLAPGGWPGLCRAAGVRPAGVRQKLRKWQKSASVGGAPVARERWEALDRAAVPLDPPHLMARVMGKVSAKWKFRRRPAAVRLRAALDRDEVLADLRLAARSAGIPVARMPVEIYLASGGRYGAHDLREFGGYTAARRAAADRAA